MNYSEPIWKLWRIILFGIVIRVNQQRKTKHKLHIKRQESYVNLLDKNWV